MKFEIPQFKRCCFCIPLRYGVLVWSYLTLIPIVFLIGNITMILINYMSFLNAADVAWLVVVLLILLANMTFTLLLIVAAHKKSISLLKIYNVCAISVAGANFLFVMALFIRIIVRMVQYYFSLWRLLDTLFFMSLWLTVIGMQVYIIALVRSEIIKLENNYKFEFSNIAAEAENAYYEPAGDVERKNATMKIENTKEETE